MASQRIPGATDRQPLLGTAEGGTGAFAEAGSVGLRPASLPYAEIKELWVLSDHKVVHTAVPITEAGGGLVPEPAWPDGSVVCHSMDAHVKLLVTLEFNGRRALRATLVGSGSGLEFKKRVKLTPGTNTFELKSREKLSKEIRQLDVELYWYFDPSDRAYVIPLLPVTFTLFVTAREPQSDEAGGVTARRLHYAVKWVAAAKSLDPFEIIKFIVDARFDDFDLTTPLDPWQLALRNKKADCRSLVKHLLAVVDMVGLRDAAKDVELEAVNLWEHPFNIALEPIPGKSNKQRFKWMPDRSNFISMETPADEKKDLNHPELYYPYAPELGPPDWRVLYRVLLFHDDDQPNAFQACLKYTDKARVVYFPGGIRKHFEAKVSGAAHREAVLKHEFKSLAWAEPVIDEAAKKKWIEGGKPLDKPIPWKGVPGEKAIKSYG